MTGQKTLPAAVQAAIAKAQLEAKTALADPSPTLASTAATTAAETRLPISPKPTPTDAQLQAQADALTAKLSGESSLDHDEKNRRVQGRIGPEIAEFKQDRRTLMLSTVSDDGFPNISYTPFVLSPEGNGFYIFISNIAQHSTNLKQNGKCALMMIQDEQDAKIIYARRRLSFSAHARLVEPDSAEWLEGVSLLRQRHGEVVDHISQFGDFNLFNLVPEHGLFVKGFGKAFKISGDELVEPVHLREGHDFDARASISEKLEG